MKVHKVSHQRGSRQLSIASFWAGFSVSLDNFGFWKVLCKKNRFSTSSGCIKVRDTKNQSQMLSLPKKPTNCYIFSFFVKPSMFWNVAFFSRRSPELPCCISHRNIKDWEDERKGTPGAFGMLFFRGWNDLFGSCQQVERWCCMYDVGLWWSSVNVVAYIYLYLVPKNVSHMDPLQLKEYSMEIVEFVSTTPPAVQLPT